MRKEKKSEKRHSALVSHVSKGSVFHDLGFSHDEIQSLKLKAQLLSQILKIVDKKMLTPRHLEKMLDQPQPRISELLNGKVSKMSLEKLVDYLDYLGEEAIISFKPKRAA